MDQCLVPVPDDEQATGQEGVRSGQMLMRVPVPGHLNRGPKIVDAGAGFGRKQLEQPPHHQQLRVRAVDLTRVIRQPPPQHRERGRCSVEGELGRH